MMPDGARTRATWHDISQPDWLIIGAPLPDGTGVALLASKHLTKARLHQLATDKLYLEQMTAGWAQTGVFLSLGVDLDDFVVAAGATYPEALEALFATWAPPNYQPSAITPDAAHQPLALEGGPSPFIDGDTGEVVTPSPYVTHLATPDGQRTICGEPWQGWQAPAALVAAKGKWTASIPPHTQPRAHVDAIRHCQGCHRVALLLKGGGPNF